VMRETVISLFDDKYFYDEIDGDQLGDTCSAHEGDKSIQNFCWKTLK
jgi:hypothetical protein